MKYAKDYAWCFFLVSTGAFIQSQWPMQWQVIVLWGCTGLLVAIVLEWRTS